MLQNYNELRNEIDSLRGNINRICVTDDINELESSYEFAKQRLYNIYFYNLVKLKKKGN